MQKSRVRSVAKNRLPFGLGILYEDTDILVADKPSGLLTVSTEHEKEKTALSILTGYIRAGCGRCRKRLFVVHRLDRDTSGVLIFAKSEEAMARLKAGWKDTEKRYLAIVHGLLAKKSGTITSYLAENEDYIVYQTKDMKKGRLCRTAYQVIGERKNFSLLEVVLLTGRKNQIRVHMAGIGHPILGDTKYGKEDGAVRMALHAWSISFRHPFQGTVLRFRSTAPNIFTKMFGPLEQEQIRKPAAPPTGMAGK